MRIQERRSGAGSHQAPAPVQPGVGERLPSAPRERKPALAALAVLLILVGALGATVLVMRAGDRIEVAMAKNDIPAGKSVTEDDVTTVLVADDSGINYVTLEQIESLGDKYQTKGTIFAGSLIVGGMLTEGSGLPEGKASVGLSLKDGQYPAGLKAGDVVAAYRVGDDGAAKGEGSGADGGSPLIVAEARVSDVPGKGGSSIGSGGNQAVTVLVDQSEAGALAQAASANEVALVLVPAAG